CVCFFFFSSRRRHTRFKCDWSSDVCSSDLVVYRLASAAGRARTSSLLLAGVAVSGVAGALASMVLSIAVADWELGRQMLSWMMRSEERRVGKEGRSGWGRY